MATKNGRWAFLKNMRSHLEKILITLQSELKNATGLLSESIARRPSTYNERTKTGAEVQDDDEDGIPFQPNSGASSVSLEELMGKFS